MPQDGGTNIARKSRAFVVDRFTRGAARQLLKEWHPADQAPAEPQI